MSRVDPLAYSWISSSELEVAGCVSLVPGAGVEAVAELFGHEVPSETSDGDVAEELATLGARGDQDEPAPEGDQIWVSVLPGAALVVEDNGFQGARTEVMREISRIGPSKVAASLFWNVNGIVMVTCARRGKVAASIDLSCVEEDDLAEVPRALRPLARLCVADDADLLAIGAAMVETYTGIGFTRADVEAATARRIVPRPSDLRTYRRGSEQWVLDSHFPDLGEVVARMADAELRRLAEWCAEAAVREAGLAEEPAVRHVREQFGSDVATSLPPGLDVLRRRYAAEAQRLEAAAEESYEEDAGGSLALNHAHLPENALESLRCTSHGDAYSAAVGALVSAVAAFSCTRSERGAHFVEDERGRSLDRVDPPPRMERFVDVARQVMSAPSTQWPALTRLLPEPPTAAALAAAVDVDRRLQEAGAFDTYHVVATRTTSTASRVDPSEQVDHEARVRARYLQLQERDRAILARGPITAGPLEPANPGGFAVAFADGLRVERLPVGRFSGTLYLTYVFTHEFGFDDGLRGRRGSSPYERISYRGPDGALRPGGGSGSGSDTALSWHTRLGADGLSWIQLDYRENNKTVATEKIRLD